MIDDTLIHPPGWSFQMELLCTLSVTPAPLSLLADDFRASFAAIHGALDGIDGLEFGVNVTDGCTVCVAPKFTAQLRGRCLAYWRTVYDQQAVAA
jgi:hypothetical protein